METRRSRSKLRLRPSSAPLRVFGLQLAGHVEQQVLVVDHLQLTDVGLRLQVGGGRLCIHGYRETQSHRQQTVATAVAGACHQAETHSVKRKSSDSPSWEHRYRLIDLTISATLCCRTTMKTVRKPQVSIRNGFTEVLRNHTELTQSKAASEPGADPAAAA